jgi:hypothetical protein
MLFVVESLKELSGILLLSGSVQEILYVQFLLRSYI